MAKKKRTQQTTSRRSKAQVTNLLANAGKGSKVLANDVANRKPGPFWIRFKDEPGWEVGLWENNEWWTPGMETGFNDTQLAEIGPRIEPPEGIELASAP